MKKFVLVFMISNFLFAQGDLLWKKEGTELPSSGTSWSTPLIMNNKIFWAGQDKGLVALNAETGDIVWADTLNFNNGTYDSPVGYAGKIFISKNNYINPSERSLLALDAETGNIIWQKNNFYTSNRSSKPIHESGNLYAATNDTLYCFDINDGTVIWQKAGKYSNMLIDYNGLRLFAARSDSAIIEVMYCNDGSKLWTMNLPDPEVSIASLAYTYYQTREYLIIAPGTMQNPTFYCIDIAAQNITWSSNLIGYVGNKAAPAIYQDKIFVGVAKLVSSVPQEVVALNLLTGNILWQNQARSEGATNTPYVVALDGKLFYTTSVNDLNAGVAADINNGTILWNTQPQFQNPWPLVWGSPLIHNNKLYIAKDHEGIFCYNAGTVNGEWTMLGGNFHATNSFTNALVGIEIDNLEIPAGYALHQNYPNPFNPATIISFSIPEEGNVKLKVYDVLGKEAAVIVNGYLNSGNYKTEFNANNLSSGIYFYKLETNGRIISKKMNLVK